MSTFDIALVVFLLVGAFLGYRKGLLMEIVSLIAIVLALTLSFKFLQWGMDLIKEKIGYFDNLLPFIAFLALFIGILIAVYMLGKVLKKMIDLTPFGTFDSLLGALLGIFKWGLALSVIVWLFVSADVQIPEKLTADSVLYPYLVQTAPWVIAKVSAILPMANDLVDKIKELLNAPKQ